MATRVREPGNGFPLLEMEPRRRSLQTVVVKKGDLLDKVQKNRDEHREIFEKALEGWKKAVTEALEEAVEDAREGRGYKINLGLARPADHTKEYDQVIEMLKMSQDEELELTHHEFQQFVMDEWGWQAAFLASSSSYTPEAQGKFNRMYGDEPMGY